MKWRSAVSGFCQPLSRALPASVKEKNDHGGVQSKMLHIKNREGRQDSCNNCCRYRLKGKMRVTRFHQTTYRVHVGPLNFLKAPLWIETISLSWNRLYRKKPKGKKAYLNVTIYSIFSLLVSNMAKVKVWSFFKCNKVITKSAGFDSS